MTRGMRQVRHGAAAFGRFAATAPLWLMPAVLCMLVSAMIPAAVQAVPVGTEIVNTAVVHYAVGAMPVAHPSNQVTIITIRSRSVLTFLRYAPEDPSAESVIVSTTYYSTNGTTDGEFSPLANPVTGIGRQEIPVNTTVPLVPADNFRRGEPIFVQLVDPDQNLDNQVIEQIAVSINLGAASRWAAGKLAVAFNAGVASESEVILLNETGPDTGIFTGYIQTTSSPAVEGDGSLSVGDNTAIEASYTDVVDNTDVSVDVTLVNPFCLVFNSQTGEPVNGAAITIVDVATGLPALVYGDDGTTSFPSVVTSGMSVTDGSGRTYSMPPGGYVFPFIPPGTYRIEVVPPGTYNFPSRVSDLEIQLLPGGPFHIRSGSRGETFEILPEQPLYLDLPVDPDERRDPGAEYIWVVKTPSTSAVDIGGFLQYSLAVENGNTVPVTGAVVTDILPLGFRYQAGSATRDGDAEMTPTISDDGRTMRFTLGSLAAGSTTTITYVVAVTPGARPGDAVNRAWVDLGAGSVSNTASARVRVREDLFNDTTTILGQVIEDTAPDVQADADSAAVPGIVGVRVYLEDGTYTITDERGLFHFEGVRPGVHVVQLDLDSVPPQYEVVPRERNSRFAGRAYSQFVDIQPGMAWRADFHLALRPRQTGEARLELSAETTGGVIVYTLQMAGDTVPVGNLRATVILPEGVAYRPGSSRIDGEPVADPGAMGAVLTYRLGDMGSDWTHTLAFTVTPESSSEPGDMVATGMLTFDTPAERNARTPLATTVVLRKIDSERIARPDIVLHPHFASFSAELDSTDRTMLNETIEALRGTLINRIYAVGHSDNLLIRERSRHIFPDNYALSEARALAVGRYIADALGVPPALVTVIGLGPEVPIADNVTPDNRALNRRVELTIVSEEEIGRSGLEVARARDAASLVTEGLRPGETAKRVVEPEKTGGMPDFGAAWVEQAEPGFDLVWPPEDHNPPIPSITIVLKHDPRQVITLLNGGKEVDRLNLDSVVENGAGTVAATRWTGVDLVEGWNTFTAVAADSTGKEIARIDHRIHLSGPPVRFTLDEAHSVLVADGRTVPVVAVRMTDKDGRPVREGIVGAFSVEPPYVPRRLIDELERQPLTGEGSRQIAYSVGNDGTACIELDPTVRTGEVVVRFPLRDDEEEIRAWLRPGEREWVIVGLAEGAMGYNDISRNLEPLPEGDAAEEYYEDGRVALFAKGRVRGDWLLTLAYDSARSAGDADRSLFNTIDPDAYFTVYGDATRQQYDAASGDKFYIRMERDQFYALYGYYNTGLTFTELSRYNRSFNGVKSELQAGRFGVNAFANESSQAFVKDEIPGDGTSGLYRLSRGDIVVNSEKVAIEIRDRFRTEVILSRRSLVRHVDYDIDYDAATVFFKEPVHVTNEDFNPIYITVDYETMNGAESSYTYGGRGSVRFRDRAVEAGATYIHEGRPAGDAELAGVDVRVRLGTATEFRGEIARSEGDADGRAGARKAYLAEIIRRSGRLDGRLYVRENEDGFGLGQQRLAESGTRKVGIDVGYRLGATFMVTEQLFRQFNLENGAERDMAETRLNYMGGRYSSNVGFRHAEERFADGETNRADLLTTGAAVRLLRNKLQLRVTREQALGENENAAFPTRSVAGADFQLTESARIFVEQEIAEGAKFDSQHTRTGITARPWKGSDASASVERRFTENEVRLFANLGLRQSWQVSERLMLDAGLDRARTIMNEQVRRFSTNAPDPMLPDTDYTAVSLGSSYRLERFTWTARAEVRLVDKEDKWGIITGMYGEPRKGFGLSAAIRLLHTSVGAKDNSDGSVRLGLAWRPEGSRWIVLNRLDYLTGGQAGGSFDVDSRRIVNTLKTDFRFAERHELSFTLGEKYAIDAIDGRDYTGLLTLLGIEHRYDIGERWDIGFRANMLHEAKGGRLQYGSGISLGWSAIDNVWVSVGYNVIGFEERDFSRSEYTAQGPYIRFRTKIDQDVARAAWGLFGGALNFDRGGRE